MADTEQNTSGSDTSITELPDTGSSVDKRENESEKAAEQQNGLYKAKAYTFLAVHWRGLCCVLIPFILILILLPFPPAKFQWCGYTLVLMALYWVTECIPLPVTSILPIIIFPLTGVMNTSTACKCYMNDTIIMFLGSLMMANAVEQSGLHKRIALCAVRAIGYSHYKILFAVCFITMFISMWITNTAATTLMVPIVFALLKVFEDQGLLEIYETNDNGDISATDITVCYFCAVTFAATIGGIGTLVGTATNLVFKGLFQTTYTLAPDLLSFPLFSAFAVPYMLCMNLCMYGYLLVVYMGFLRPNSVAANSTKIPQSGIEAAKMAVDTDWKALGKMRFREYMVIILFGGAIIMFFCRSPQIFTGWGDAIKNHFGIKDDKFIRDSACAMFIVFLMVLMPSNLNIFKNCSEEDPDELPKEPIKSVLDWRQMNRSLPYSFMFLLGGGCALALAAKPEYSNLNGEIGKLLKKMRDMPNLAIILIIIIFTVFITNFASNVAICNVISPIAMQLADEINRNPLWYNIAAGFSASYCFMLPVGTPGNLIVQGAAKIPTSKMIIAGTGPTVSTIIITWLAVSFWAPVIWPQLLTQPSWVKPTTNI